tara:strand:- start:2678 stop:3844 length:1167 start_codon:yes stop_codon:yes gene_type:complete
MTVDLISYYSKGGKNHRYFTGLMTGIGILGTFFGVVVGLQDFDPQNVGGSIGPLLEGLKVSFATSVGGLFAAIFTEVIERAFPSKRASVGDPIVDTLNQHMHGLSDLIEGAQKANESVANNVAGLRTEMRDESTKVRKALEMALEQLSKGATEEIIKALENVIEDFNRNLSEQFGENFKQLNEACLRLVEWQGAYKSAVESATDAITSAKGAIDGSKEQLEAAVPQKERFYEIVQSTGLSIKALALLNDRLETLSETQKMVIEGFSMALEDVRTKAHSLETDLKLAAVSVSAEQMEVINNFSSLAKIAEESSGRIEVMLGEHARGHKEVSDNIAEVVKKLDSGNQELQGHLGKALNELERNLSSLTGDFGAAYSRYIELMRTLTASAN